MYAGALSRILKLLPVPAIDMRSGMAHARTVVAAAARLAVTTAFVSAVLADNVGAQRPPEEKTPMTWGIEAGRSSGYAWRGLMISDAPVAEAAAWLYVSGFTFSGWQNLARSDTSDDTRPEVSDLYVAYEHEWRRLTIEPSLETFRYSESLSGEAWRSTEAAVELSYAAGPARLFALHGVDISAYDGASYTEAGVAHERWVRDRAYFEIALRAGLASTKFNEVNVGIPKRAVNFVGIDASLTYYVTPRFYLRPHLELGNVVDDEIRAEVLDPRPRTFGLAMGAEF